MLFLWTEGNKGRPVAAAQFFVQEMQWHHEFQSLSTGGFDAHCNDDGSSPWVWRPARHGLTWSAAERIGPPAQSASQRLRQMKTIAERFGAEVDQGGTFENPEQLRLLTTPIYRYAAAEQGILDGAIFAFVQGTNPEVLVLVEAEGKASAARAWRYGFARMSCFFLRVHQGGQLAWSAERAPVPTPDAGSSYFFRLNAQVDRSAGVEVSPARDKAR
jgi:hypothetical protein